MIETSATRYDGTNHSVIAASLQILDREGKLYPEPGGNAGILCDEFATDENEWTREVGREGEHFLLTPADIVYEGEWVVVTTIPHRDGYVFMLTVLDDHRYRLASR